MPTPTAFTWAHRDDDPAALALQKPPVPGWSMPDIARQVEALRRIKTKIPAWYREGLTLPSGVPLEQCSSEATARFKAGLFSGARALDLTGGLGVDTYFLAQSFEAVDYVEQQEALCAAARHNFEVLGQGNVRVHHSTAAAFLERAEASAYDLIYLDPARRGDRQQRVFRLEDCSPDVLGLRQALFRLSDKVLLKTAPLLDLQLAMAQLQQVARIWVLAVGDECKEVLYGLDKNAVFQESIPIEAVQIKKDGSATTFAFDFEAERAAAAPLSLPLQYLYEPHAAILKAGAFKSFAVRYGLSKLHPHSHLYTSDRWQPEVPGRGFEVKAVCKYDKKSVAAWVPEGSANIATRNFPESAETVRKKLGLKEGGAWYLFATTEQSGKKVVLVCQKPDFAVQGL